MAATFQVRGAEQLVAVGKALRDAGQKELKREFVKGLKDAARPLGDDVKRHADDYLPGGVADEIASARITVQVRLSGRNAGVRLTGVKRKRGGTMDLGAINRGVVRHPVFGHRDRWVSQEVKPGFWSEQLQSGQAVAEVGRRLGEVIDRALSRIASS